MTTSRRTDLIIEIRPSEVRKAALAVIFLLTGGHLVFVVPQTPLRRVFDLDLEAGIGTWVSSSLFTFAAMASLLLAALLFPTRRYRGFAAFGVVVLALGLEEVAAFHESASVRVADAANVGGSYSGGTPLMGVALLPFAAVGLLMLARGMAGHARRQLLLGGVVWYLATFLTEQLDAWYLDGALRSSDPEAMHRLITGVQEGGEMLGVALVLCALLEELVVLTREAVLRFSDGSRRA